MNDTTIATTDKLAIVVCHRLSDGKLIAVRSAMVGQDGVKPDVWYSLDANGEFIEVPE